MTRDPEFFELAPMPVDTQVVGFVLSTNPELFSTVPKRFIEDPSKHMNSLRYELVSYRPSRAQRSKPVSSKALALTLLVGSAFAAFAALALRIGGAFTNRDWLFVALGSIGIPAFAFTGFALTRLYNAIRREGVDTLRSVLGLATAPPVWITLNKSTDLIWVDHGHIDTTKFQMRGIDLRTVLRRTHDDCMRQIEALITDGRSIALSN
jgi:hypothetical protein